MATVALALPLAPGREEAWRIWMQELLGSRHDEYMAQRERLGIRSEQWWIAHLKGMDVVIVMVRQEVDSLESLEACTQLTTSSDPFDVWYCERFHAVFDFEIITMPSRMLLEQVATWATD